jgi:hypothetical protein
MERGNIIFIITFVIIINFAIVSAEDFGYNLIQADDFNNNTASVNSSNYWNTGDRGVLRNVADILHNWLDTTSLLWSNANHTMDTDLDMNANDIIDVGNLEVNNNGTFGGNVSATYFIGNGSLLTGIIAGLWESVAGVSQLITAQDINMQNQSLSNVENITLRNSIKDSDTEARIYFDPVYGLVSWT